MLLSDFFEYVVVSKKNITRSQGPHKYKSRILRVQLQARLRAPRCGPPNIDRPEPAEQAIRFLGSERDGFLYFFFDNNFVSFRSFLFGYCFLLFSISYFHYFSLLFLVLIFISFLIFSFLF